MSSLGEALAGQERSEEAELLLLEGYEGLREAPQASDSHQRDALQRVVDLYDAWDKPEKAQEYRALLPGGQDATASD